MTKRAVMYVLGSLNAGGAERQVLTLVQGLRRTDWRPVVCGMRGGTLYDDFSAAAPVHALEKRHVVDLVALAHLAKLLEHYRPAVLHTYMSTGNTWGRIAALLVSSTQSEALPVVVASERSIDTWKTFAHHLVDRVLLGVTDTVACNSMAVTRYVIERDRVPPQLVMTIPNGIDLHRAQRLLRCSPEDRRARRAAFGLGPDDFVIGHIGRSSPVKGLDVLVRVFDGVKKRIPSARLLRVAQTPLPDEVRPAEDFMREVSARGLADSVVVQPYVPDIASVLAILDALVQTSVREGLPNVVMEAMAAEVPIVATAAGGTVELVQHHQHGWIVPVGDIDGLVAGLEHAFRHREEVRGWAVAARKRIEAEYTNDVMVSRTVALYERLLARRAVG